MYRSQGGPGVFFIIVLFYYCFIIYYSFIFSFFYFLNFFAGRGGGGREVCAAPAIVIPLPAQIALKVSLMNSPRESVRVLPTPDSSWIGKI